MMRKTRFVILIAALGLVTSSSLAYADEIRVLADEVTSTFKSATTPYNYTPTIATELVPGLKVYTEDGQLLGTVSAFTQRDGVTKRIWFADRFVDGQQVTLENGKVILMADTPTGVTG
jgi:hypothetical protein